MSQKPVNPYLKTKIMTARPEELRLMLYDGELKFCRQAKVALEKKNYEESYNNLMRAQKIVLELSTSLNYDADPAICQRLSALYTYVYRLLVDANMKRESPIVDEAIKLIEYERETWQMLMKKLAGEGRPTDASITTAQQTAISSLSQSA